MQPLTLTAMTTANPLGLGLAATWDGLRHDRHGYYGPTILRMPRSRPGLDESMGLETEPITGALAEFDCRNNRLALAGLRQDEFERSRLPRARTYGPDRIGVLIGTTTSGILETEIAYRQRDHRMGHYRRPSATARPKTCSRSAPSSGAIYD